MPVGAGSESFLGGLSGRGQPLPRSLRAHMEPRFGTDFGAVQLHTGTEAAASARALGARAYTYANHVVFGAGEYAPEHASGRRLIAHELAHVVQQRTLAPSAQRVMRSTYTGCDKATTGVDNAAQRIDDARDQALRALTTAVAAFPRMNTRTIRLVNRHFHCPSNSQIRTIMKNLAEIKAALPALKATCAAAADSICKDGELGWVWHEQKLIELCPPAFAAGARQYRFAASFISGAAQTLGLKRDCVMADACYDDFTTPAGTMVNNVSSYAALALELAGNNLPAPATIPCAAHDTGLLVFVPPDATDPAVIRRVTGFNERPSGAMVLSVFADDAGNQFIYHDHLPGAKPYLPGESSRYYFAGGRAP